ncbi:hydrolase [Streptomyces telluris]|uniref:Hydrolase n=2 Tax=Streptomyces TaxID=1883 RepID=A0A9X2LP78_9ACTN|nr:hydrolase [Streptomyces telluris]MCQ8774745.1 hydrolase [Streptomyces telluris]NJP81805.1 hydrolase [Streptomyces telluris]QBK46628.1 HrsG [Streptomyces hiroshimensis]
MTREAAAAAPTLLEAAVAAAPLAAAHAADAEADRRLSPPVVEAIVAAGFSGHFAPAALGGAAGTFAELLDASAALGEGCASAAWFASVIASAGRLTAYLPREGREGVWAKGPQTVVVAGLMPSGTAERAPGGGWRVTGSWNYVSAVDFSDWTLIAARTGEQGTGVRVLAVPRTDYAISETWQVIGMRGTGSNTVVLDEVLVPDAFTVPLDVLLAGLAPEAEAACHRVPMKAANGVTLAGPLLGATRGALRRWRELVAAKLAAPAGAISGGSDHGTFEQLLARAEGEIDAAGLLLERVARTTDSGAVDGLGTARNGRDCALAAEMLATVSDRLLRSAGTRAQAEGEELQRRWRDVNCGAGHSGLQFPAAAGAYARLLNASA